MLFEFLSLFFEFFSYQIVQSYSWFSKIEILHFCVNISLGLAFLILARNLAYSYEYKTRVCYRNVKEVNIAPPYQPMFLILVAIHLHSLAYSLIYAILNISSQRTKTIYSILGNKNIINVFRDLYRCQYSLNANTVGYR